MRAFLDTAGEGLAIECAVPWVAELISEGTVGALRTTGGTPTVRVSVEADPRPFPVRGWEVLARGAWRRRGEVVLENVCTSGFDVHARAGAQPAELTFRWRPPARERAATLLLRSRFHLLARAVLVQYPALWAAGACGRAPLHASAVATRGATPLLVAQSGVGRSTLLVHEVRDGACATGDNLAVCDGDTVWGLVEPMRVDGPGGRRMPHGRRERPLPARATALMPDSVVVLRRGTSEPGAVRACDADAAAAALIAGTYMAGELRRYWSFAAALAAGTRVGPPHPPVVDVARRLASRLPCRTLDVGGRAPLAELFDTVEVAA